MKSSGKKFEISMDFIFLVSRIFTVIFILITFSIFNPEFDRSVYFTMYK